MTVVNPKSISGITSITMASGSDNLLTIHTTNTTERVRVNSDGDVIVGSGITVSPDGDIFATGVTTSTTFVGALTGTASGNAVLTGSTNNTVTTVTGANAIQGESTLIYDGTNLDIDSDSGHLRIGDDQDLDLYHNGSNGYLKNSTGQLLFRSGTHTFEDAAGSSEYARIDSSGRLLIGTTTEGQADADNLTIADSGSCGITIRSGTSAAGSIYFSDATSGAAEYDGAVIYNQSSQFMAVYTAQDERLRIDSNGNLLFNSGFGSVTTVYGCRAWIQVNQGGSQSITGSGGVSSITDDGTGVTRITFTTTMPDDNYAMVGGAQQSDNSSVNYGFSLCMQTYTTTYAILIYRPTATSDVKQDNSKIHVAFFR